MLFPLNLSRPVHCYSHCTIWDTNTPIFTNSLLFYWYRNYKKISYWFIKIILLCTQLWATFDYNYRFNYPIYLLPCNTLINMNIFVIIHFLSKFTVTSCEMCKMLRNLNTCQLSGKSVSNITQLSLIIHIQSF